MSSYVCCEPKPIGQSGDPRKSANSSVISRCSTAVRSKSCSTVERLARCNNTCRRSLSASCSRRTIPSVTALASSSIRCASKYRIPRRALPGANRAKTIDRARQFSSRIAQRRNDHVNIIGLVLATKRVGHGIAGRRIERRQLTNQSRRPIDRRLVFLGRMGRSMKHGSRRIQQFVENIHIAMNAQLRHRQVAGHDFPTLSPSPQHDRAIEPNRLHGTTSRLHEKLLRASAPMIEHPQRVEPPRKRDRRRPRSVGPPLRQMLLTGLQRLQRPSQRSFARPPAAISKRVSPMLKQCGERPTAAAGKLTRPSAETLLFTARELHPNAVARWRNLKQRLGDFARSGSTGSHVSSPSVRASQQQRAARMLKLSVLSDVEERDVEHHTFPMTTARPSTDLSRYTRIGYGCTPSRAIAALPQQAACAKSAGRADTIGLKPPLPAVRSAGC